MAEDVLLTLDQAELVLGCAALIGGCRDLLCRAAEEEGEKPTGARRWALRTARRAGLEPGDKPLDDDAGPAEVALWFTGPLIRAAAAEDPARLLIRLRSALQLDRLFNDRSLTGIVALTAGFRWPAAAYPVLFAMLLAEEDRPLAETWLEAAGVDRVTRAAAEAQGLPDTAAALAPLPAANAIAALGAVLARARAEAARDRREAGRLRRELEEARAETARLRDLLAEARARREPPKREKAAECPSCSTLAARLRDALADRAALEARCRELEREVEEGRREAALALEAMREALAQAWAGDGEQGREGERPPAPDGKPLAGLRIAVVGDPGRREEYRRLVEEAGAEFLFQDGCEGETRVERLAGADGIVALCDWLNHKAFAHLRRLERAGVPVVYRPTNGLASARAGLERLAEMVGGQARRADQA